MLRLSKTPGFAACFCLGLAAAGAAIAPAAADDALTLVLVGDTGFGGDNQPVHAGPGRPCSVDVLAPRIAEIMDDSSKKGATR